jgi:hypothetical protein
MRPFSSILLLCWYIDVCHHGNPLSHVPLLRLPPHERRESRRRQRSHRRVLVSFLFDARSACAPLIRGNVGHDARDVLAAAPPGGLIWETLGLVEMWTLRGGSRTARVACSFLAHGDDRIVV